MDNNTKDYLYVNGKSFKIPDVALGKTLPDYIFELERFEAAKAKAERKARIYFWGGIICSILCMIVGYLLGKFCRYIAEIITLK